MRSRILLAIFLVVSFGCQNKAYVKSGSIEPKLNQTLQPDAKSLIGFISIHAESVLDDSFEKNYFDDSLKRIGYYFTNKCVSNRSFIQGKFSIEIDLNINGTFTVKKVPPGFQKTIFYNFVIEALEHSVPFPPWTAKMKNISPETFPVTILFDCAGPQNAEQGAAANP